MALTVGSLFSGIGGIDLGLERAGMVTRWFCEIDPHCRNVLARHWPGLPIYGDITAIDWSGVERVDVLAGGFPCQPISIAGRGLAQEDDRWLWPEFERAIRVLRPRYVLVENVAALRRRGLGIVLGGLAALGYDAEWDCIPAAAVGAPHERDRLWLVAYANGSADSAQRGECAAVAGESAGGRTQRVRGARDAQREEPIRGAGQVAGILADAEREGLEGATGSGVAGEGWPTSIFANGDTQLGGKWDAEPGVGRVAHGVPDRVERLRSLGNAVVPQVVEWIGHHIVAFDEERVAA